MVYTDAITESLELESEHYSKKQVQSEEAKADEDGDEFTDRPINIKAELT